MPFICSHPSVQYRFNLNVLVMFFSRNTSSFRCPKYKPSPAHCGQFACHNHLGSRLLLTCSTFHQVQILNHAVFYLWNRRLLFSTCCGCNVSNTPSDSPDSRENEFFLIFPALLWPDMQYASDITNGHYHWVSCPRSAVLPWAGYDLDKYLI